MATRATLRSRARVRADQDNSTFPTDSQYNDLLDEAAKEVWYDLVQAGWPLRFSTTTFTTSGSQLNLLGVTGVAFVRGVYYSAGGVYQELPRIQEGDRASLYSSQTNQPQGYQVLQGTNGTHIEILPFTSGASILVEYIAEYAGFANDADTWFGPARSDDLIVLLAAMKGMRKEGNDQGARELEREYVRVFDKVVNMASWVDMRNAPTIRNTGDQLTPGRLPFDFDI